MGVETKKMTNSIATASGDFGDRIKSWPERIKTFYGDVRPEMKKVTSPSRKEVQGTTTVVIITVFLFAFFFCHVCAHYWCFRILSQWLSDASRKLSMISK